MKTSYYGKTPRGTPGAISISRYLPKNLEDAWVRNEIGWYPKLAPSKQLLEKVIARSITVEEYCVEFEEGLKKLDPAYTWEKLEKMAMQLSGYGTEPILLCYEKPKPTFIYEGAFPEPSHKEYWFCHRRLVALWFEWELHQIVREVYFPTSPSPSTLPPTHTAKTPVSVSANFGEQIQLF